MKRILNIGLLLIAVAFIASCSNKYTIYHPSGEDVSFNSDAVLGLANADQTPITVSIYRGLANSSISIPLSFKSYTIEEQTVYNPETEQDETVEVEVPNTCFALQTAQVALDVNEFSKDLQVTYDYSQLVPGVDYYFEISFDENIAGPAGFNTVVGNIKMKLEYEDYKNCSYDESAYVNLDKMAFDYITGPLVTEMADIPVVLQRAKGTTDYYKLICFGDMELEFQTVGGKLVIVKYDGYNDRVATLNATYVIFSVTIGADTYNFSYYPSRITVSTTTDGKEIPTGAYFTFNGWIRKNGTYWPNSYNTYHWINVD